jgi:poly(3-hydroxyalkanoate) depolymerase
MREHADTALRLLDLLNVERCHVMGISWGGALAQQFTRQYPRRVEKLILAATSTGQLMLPPKLSVVLRMATPLRYFSPRFLHRVAGDIYGGDFRHDPAKAAGILGRMSPPSLRGYLGQVYALAGWTSLFWLHRLETPTLVLAGRDDPIVPLANARMLATRMPDASLQVYNCGHLFVLTRLDQVVADIARFLYPPG